MAKQKISEPVMNDTCGTTDNASDLIYRLVVFYNNNPEYKTNLIEINLLMRMAYQELEKFTHRPHTQVTKVYFDSDGPKANIV